MKIDKTTTECGNLLNVFHNADTWNDNVDFIRGLIPPLQVPEFQRPYEWPEHMVISFTSKLFETYLRRQESSCSEVHFASTVFLHLEENPSKTCPKNMKCRALIMDGQQRLITLSLILLVLKDRLSQFHSKHSKKTASSLSLSSPTEDYNLEGMITNLKTRLFSQSPKQTNPRLTAHPDQQEAWCSFLEQDDENRETWAPEPLGECPLSEIFPKNYKAISETISTCIHDHVDSSGEQTRARTEAMEKEEERVYYDFSDLLLGDLVHGVKIVRTGSLQQSLRMLAGINTPGKPLDPVAHLKFQLREKRTDDDSEGFKSFVKGLGGAATSSSVMVAACALLPEIKLAAEEITDPIVILMKSLESFKVTRLHNSEEEDDEPVFFSVFADSVKGLNAEENYWCSAIHLAQYLENLDANPSSTNANDRALMPLLALSNIKPSTDKSHGKSLVDTSSTATKTLRLIRSLLVAIILACKGSVESGNLNVTNADNFKNILLGLEGELLYNLVCKRQQGSREDNVLKLISTKLKNLNENSEQIRKLSNDDATRLLDQLHSNSVPQDPIAEAGKRFAVLLACQPPQDMNRPFDGLDGIFELEHIVAKESKDESVAVALKNNYCLHRLGNLCLLEKDINTAAGNRSFTDKKQNYKYSKYYVPLKLSVLLPGCGDDPPSSWDFQDFAKRHREMLCYLHKRLRGTPPGDELYKIDVPTTSQPTASLPEARSVVAIENRDSSNPEVSKALRKLLHTKVTGQIIAENCPKAFNKNYTKVSRDEFLAVKHIMCAKSKGKYISADPSRVALTRHSHLLVSKDPLLVSSYLWGTWKYSAEEWWKKNGGDRWTKEHARKERQDDEIPSEQIIHGGAGGPTSRESRISGEGGPVSSGLDSITGHVIAGIANSIYCTGGGGLISNDLSGAGNGRDITTKPLIPLNSGLAEGSERVKRKRDSEVVTSSNNAEVEDVSNKRRRVSQPKLNLRAAEGDINEVKDILSKGSDVESKDKWGNTPLHYAAFNGHFEIVEMLLEHGAQIEFKGNGNATPLNLACQKGHLRVVEHLINKGANLEACDEEGWRPLHTAVSTGHLDIVRYLLSREGIDIEAKDYKGFTPLMLASFYGRVEIADILLNKRANIDCRNNGNTTSLYLACQEGHFGVVDLLINKGANIELKDSEGFGPLHTAVTSFHGHIHIVNLLLKHGAKIESETNMDKTALFLACECGLLDVVKCLTGKGANLEAKDFEGYRPLHAAADNGHMGVVEFLIDKGVNLNACASDGWTPLHSATDDGKINIIKFLIDKGADIHARTKDGSSLLDIAQKKNHLEIIEFFKKLRL